MPESKPVNDPNETAARAGINERCAPALLHDIRGSLQALFSAIELLSRSARGAEPDPDRLQKCTELARRAAQRHEETTMDAVQLLIMQKSAAKALDWHALLQAAVEFLRNDLSRKDLKAALSGTPGPWVRADRSALQAAILDILTAVIDDLPEGATLRVTVEERGDFAAAVITPFGDSTEVGATPTAAMPAAPTPPTPPTTTTTGGPTDRRALSLFFASRFLLANGGRLEREPGSDGVGALFVLLPLER